MRRSERIAAKQVTKEAENATPSLPPTPSISPMDFSIEQLVQVMAQDPNPAFSPNTTRQILTLHDVLSQQGVLNPLPPVFLTELTVPPTPQTWSYPLVAETAPPPPPVKGKRRKNAPYPPPKPKPPKRNNEMWHVVAHTSSAPINPEGPQEATSKLARKDVFKTYEKPPVHVKPKWAKIWTMEEMQQFREAGVKEVDYGPHSEMGWVLAKLREPDCGARGRYGWAIAEVHEPRESMYHILSGPHVKAVKFVRNYDRRPYSPEEIAKLKAEQDEKPAHIRDYIYDTITMDVAELVANSSAYGTTSAVQGFDAIPRGDQTEFWKKLMPALPSEY